VRGVSLLSYNQGVEPQEIKESILAKLFAIDLRTLAIFRIVLGILCLGYFFSILPLLDIFFTDSGVVPRELVHLRYRRVVSVNVLGGSYAFQLSLWILSVLSATLFLVGYRVLWITPVLWYLLTSFHIRCIHMPTVGDEILSITLLWCIFLPLGERISLDSLRSGVDKAKASILSFASAGLLLQIAAVFFFSALMKLGSPAWQSGHALSVVLSDETWIRPLGSALRNYEELSQWLTYSVLLIEFCAPILLFLPFFTRLFRGVGILALSGLAFGMGLCIQLGNIPFVLFALLLPFVPLSRSATVKIIRPPALTISQIIPALMIAFLIVANIQAINPSIRLIPLRLQTLARSFNAAQGWGMYANPYVGSGRVRVELRVSFDDDTSKVYAFGSSREFWEQTSSWKWTELFWDSFHGRMYLYDEISYPETERETTALLDWLSRKWFTENEFSSIEQKNVTTFSLEKTTYNFVGTASETKETVVLQTLPAPRR